LTIAISGEEVAIFSRPEYIDIANIQKITGDHFDIWLIEGDRSADHPKIVVTRNLTNFSEYNQANIVATIGPEKISSTIPHFETDDYNGLGDFVISKMLDKKTEIAG
jgi:molybdopterin-guanine dinucleotide biosynthesis protein